MVHLSCSQGLSVLAGDIAWTLCLAAKICLCLQKRSFGLCFCSQGLCRERQLAFPSVLQPKSVCGRREHRLASAASPSSLAALLTLQAAALVSAEPPRLPLYVSSDITLANQCLTPLENVSVSVVIYFPFLATSSVIDVPFWQPANLLLTWRRASLEDHPSQAQEFALQGI